MVGLEVSPGSPGRGREVGKGRKGRDRGCIHEQGISVQMLRSPLRSPQRLGKAFQGSLTRGATAGLSVLQHPSETGRGRLSGMGF